MLGSMKTACVLFAMNAAQVDQRLDQKSALLLVLDYAAKIKHLLRDFVDPWYVS